MSIKWLLSLLLECQRVQQVQVTLWMVVSSVLITDDLYWELSSNKNSSTSSQSPVKVFSFRWCVSILLLQSRSAVSFFPKENAFKSFEASCSTGFHPNSRAVFRKFIFDSFSWLLYRRTEHNETICLAENTTNIHFVCVFELVPSQHPSLEGASGSVEVRKSSKRGLHENGDGWNFFPRTVCLHSFWRIEIIRLVSSQLWKYNIFHKHSWNWILNTFKF